MKLHPGQSVRIVGSNGHLLSRSSTFEEEFREEGFQYWWVGRYLRGRS